MITETTQINANFVPLFQDESLEPAASEPQKPLSSPSLKPEASEFRKPLASQGVIGVSPSNKMNATSETKELKFKSVTSTISDSDFEARKHISENNTNISDNNLKVLEEENEVIENLELDTGMLILMIICNYHF